MIDKKDLIDLNECVVNALKLFIEKGVPKLKSFNFKRPIVLGSGNAAITGKILFGDTDAVFADESNFIEKLNTVKNIDGAILISASGRKHAPIIAEELKKRNIETILLTNTKDSPAGKIIAKTYVFEKNIEPYTYDTSSYLGMILAKTKEDPRKILDAIKLIDKQMPKDLSKYDAIFMIIPDRFENMREMLVTKFDELFGPMLVGRVYTPDQAKHGRTVIESDKELFISFGYENKIFGKNRINIELLEKSDYGTLMALGYYVIGLIQKAKPPYFKDNIASFIDRASKFFNEKIEMIA